MAHESYYIKASEALWHGAEGFGRNLWFGIDRTAKDLNLLGGKKGKIARFETKRFVIDIAACAKMALHKENPIFHLILIVVEEYYKLFPEIALKAIAKKAGIIAAYAAGKYMICRTLALKITKAIIIKYLQNEALKAVLTKIAGCALSVLMIQGVIEEASRAANRLRIKQPVLYTKLKKHNLEMMYFLVEKPLSKYTTTIAYAMKHPAQFNTAIKKEYLLT